MRQEVNRQRCLIFLMFVEIGQRLDRWVIPWRIGLTLDLRYVHNHIATDLWPLNEVVNVAPLIQRAIELWFARDEFSQYFALNEAAFDSGSLARGRSLICISSLVSINSILKLTLSLFFSDGLQLFRAVVQDVGTEEMGRIQIWIYEQ